MTVAMYRCQELTPSHFALSASAVHRRSLSLSRAVTQASCFLPRRLSCPHSTRCFAVAPPLLPSRSHTPTRKALRKASLVRYSATGYRPRYHPALALLTARLCQHVLFSSVSSCPRFLSGHSLALHPLRPESQFFHTSRHGLNASPLCRPGRRILFPLAAPRSLSFRRCASYLNSTTSRSSSRTRSCTTPSTRPSQASAAFLPAASWPSLATSRLSLSLSPCRRIMRSSFNRHRRKRCAHFVRLLDPYPLLERGDLYTCVIT
jgi:hypothetical protein